METRTMKWLPIGEDLRIRLREDGAAVHTSKSRIGLTEAIELVGRWLDSQPDSEAADRARAWLGAAERQTAIDKVTQGVIEGYEAMRRPVSLERAREIARSLLGLEKPTE
jgi:hypothetical protein